MQVLTEHHGNMYAANGAGIVLAEKGQFDVSKDIFTQVSIGSLLVGLRNLYPCKITYYKFGFLIYISL